jgi:hypothetical protein
MERQVRHRVRAVRAQVAEGLSVRCYALGQGSQGNVGVKQGSEAEAPAIHGSSLNMRVRRQPSGVAPKPLCEEGLPGMRAGLEQARDVARLEGPGLNTDIDMVHPTPRARQGADRTSRV